MLRWCILWMIWLGTGLCWNDAGAGQEAAGGIRVPPGFHCVRVADAELCGGSYALAFDDQGRLLVGTGETVRRLRDEDGDGRFDGYETVAEGLGWRGPQGLAVQGEVLFAVGGDGLQRLDGYGSLVEPVRRRLGEPLQTGGDHGAHTVRVGPDGYLYLVTGDGGGSEGRSHITEESSPVLSARHGAVFRISPDGRRWECVGHGGRNAPSLGMNLHGELFSLDSDMEWHVDLPWYRPVRLNHWVWGGDQGWEPVGADRSYFLDALSGVYEVGRGSPNWGAFYYHNQFPDAYWGSFLVCDYRWKSARGGHYNSGGRLLSFRIYRKGAEWDVGLTVLAEPEEGSGIDFSLVDVAVGPDGSVFLTEHNQGVWRLFYDPDWKQGDALPRAEGDFGPAQSPLSLNRAITAAIAVPQPDAAWAREQVTVLKERSGASENAWREGLERAALDKGAPLQERLRAVWWLAGDFAQLKKTFLHELSRSEEEEMRGSAAWLYGLRGQLEDAAGLIYLFEDRSGYVRRRAAEGLTRARKAEAVPALVEHLGDPGRRTRHAAMAALAHYPTGQWLGRALRHSDPQVRMRALYAARLGEGGVPKEVVGEAVGSLLIQVTQWDKEEEQLDVLRTVQLFAEPLRRMEGMNERVRHYVLDAYAGSKGRVRWEQTRVAGLFQWPEAVPLLVEACLVEKDPVEQFHIAQNLVGIREGWSRQSAVRFWDWLLEMQTGWFADWEAKGRQFPEFWGTVLNGFVSMHWAVVRERMEGVRWHSQLGSVVLEVTLEQPEGGEFLRDLYERSADAGERARLVGALGRVERDWVSDWLREALQEVSAGRERRELLVSLARRTDRKEDVALLREAFEEVEGERLGSVALAWKRVGGGAEPKVMARLIQGMREVPRLGPLLDWVLRRVNGEAAGELSDDGWEEEKREERIRYWRIWFAALHGRDPLKQRGHRSNREVLKFLLTEESQAGDIDRGRIVYTELQCHTCHGGGGEQAGAVFAPDLEGIGSRMTAAELAEALVYPSELISERFRARQIELVNGEVLTGFVTAEENSAITVATMDGVRRLDRKEVAVVEESERSLMPEGVVNGLDDQALRDLWAFLRR